VIVTDGTPDQASINKAAQAKADGIDVFVVGVGKKVNSKAMARMASDPAGTHVFGVRSYEELVSNPKIVDGITTTVCQSKYLAPDERNNRKRAHPTSLPIVPYPPFIRRITGN
jgi:hypothetical protein